MTRNPFILYSTFVFLLTTNYSKAQGCSDAGFCTINSIKPNSTDSIQVLKNQFKIGSSYGKADNSISIFGSYLEYNRALNEKFGLDAKLTTLAQNGNEIATFGFSDIYLNTNYKVSEKIKLTLGTKIPLSNSNKTSENLPLPMDYQASLGTFDLIFGVGYTLHKTQLVFAVQQPLTENKNQFLASHYPINSKLTAFQSTNKFQRGGDVLFRVSHPVDLSSKIKFTPSLLPIYHLANDKYTDEFNNKLEITGSQGLTLNGNIYLDFYINHKSSIQFNFGMPFIVRETRPDGLTRSFIMNLEYKINF